MYTPLYVKSNYTLLSSLLTIDDIIDYCVKNNIPSIALTDDNLFGMMEFYKKCLSNNIKPIIGLEIYIENYSLLIYAKNYDGYKYLINLSTMQSEKKLNLSDINDNSNVIFIIPYKSKDIFDSISSYKNIYLGYSNKKEEREVRIITDKCVFVSECKYINNSDSEYLKYLYMIRDGKTISDVIDYNILSLNLDKDVYELSSNTGLIESNKISDMCEFNFPDKELLLPVFSETNGLSSYEYLANLSKKGLEKRLGDSISKTYLSRLDYELSIIKQMDFSNYFLVVYDFIKYAKKNKILVGPGRGSGAGSLVCYSIGITDIDPIKYNLLFERFLNPERITMPDIDTDFPDIYRDQVINYVKNKYGIKKVSGIITFSTLTAKQAIRDVSKVFNIANYQVDLITKRIPSFSKNNLKFYYDNDIEFNKLINSEEKLKKMYKVASFLEGFPKYTSSHAAGIVMCKKNLDQIIPLVKNDDIYLSGFTMEYLEDLGLLKMDFLGLKTLTIIMNIIEDINNNLNIKIDFNNIPLDDEKVLEVFMRGDTTGIFQFESEGMKNFLRKLNPETLDDIFAAIALFRPGPSQNIDSYILRKEGKEKIDYLDDSLIGILKPTNGIIIYQEQIIGIANTYAGYSLGEADILRRAMSKKKMDVLKNEEEKFIEKSIEKGHSKEKSKEIFDLILKFANYGFNKSHSVAYSLIAYKMAYLKYYYPEYFYANLLDSVIGSDVKTKEYISEAKAHGINILTPDVNLSDINYKVCSNGIRLPLTIIKNINSSISKNIITNRCNKYDNLFDFLSKNSMCNFNDKVFESLINSDSLSCFNYNHNTLCHNLDSLMNYQELIKDLDSDFVLKPEIEVIDEYSKDIIIAKEKDLFGFYISNHPVTSYKTNEKNIISLNEVDKYFNKKITCIIIVDRIKSVKTKTGDEMAFVSGSDEYVSIDFTLFPKVFEKEKENIKIGNIIRIIGNVERRYNSYQIVVEKLDKLN